jgi:glycosyltransferase involved in cell wall biosynthesis
MSIELQSTPATAAVDFTVAIPTYNGEKRLPKVLERLKSQINSDRLSWEVIVVDNNSSDHTAKVVQEYQADWLPNSSLRYCFEAKQGLAYARQCAVDEAQGNFVGFLDDDTLPAPDWVASAYAFGQEHDKAGAYGGQIHGEFEVEPPENFERIQSFLAIKRRGSKAHLYDPDKLVLPPGAGLVIRKQAWLESVPRQLARTGRGGNDFEISLHMHRQGWEIWYNPTMNIYHQIPQQRLEREYLIRLIRNAGLCVCQLRLVGVKSWQKPIIMSKIFLGNLRRIILHLWKYKTQVWTDTIAACEMEFLVSSLISPFYYIKENVYKPLKNFDLCN